MSISAQKTPDEGATYFLNRLISDLVGTVSACSSSVTDIAVDSSFDCLGSVYPLIGIKGGSKELIGSAVSISGGYLLAAKHSVSGYLRPFTSYGAKTLPSLGVAIEETSSIGQSKIVDLQFVTEVADDVDLVLLRISSVNDSQLLKFARLPAFESSSLTSQLLSRINSFGTGALFVGFGAMSRTGLSQKLQKNDITTFICNQDLAAQTISQLYGAHCDNPVVEKNNKVTGKEYEHYFLTIGSSQRYPHWNDSGGGLFVFHEGKVYLVGLHFKAIKSGNNKPLTYPLFVNLLSIGSSIASLIKTDRISFLKSYSDSHQN